MAQPCSPAELEELAKLISDGHMGQTKVTDIPLEEPFNTPTDGYADLQTKRTVGGLFGFMRTGRGAMGEVLTQEILNPLFIGLNKANKVIGDFQKSMNEIVGAIGEQTVIGKAKRKFFGITPELDESLRTAFEASDSKGNIPKEIASRYTESELNAVKEIRKLTDSVASKTGISFEHFRAVRDGKVDKDTLKAAGRTFEALGQHITLRAPYRDPDQKVFGMLSEYINAATAAGLKRPLLDELTGKMNLRVFSEDGRNAMGIIAKSGPEMLRWQSIKAEVMGQPTALDISFGHAFDQLNQYFKFVTPGLAGVHRYTTIMSDLAWSGTMGAPIIGGRPSSIIRQFGQLVPSWAEYGGKITREAMSDALKDIRAPGSVTGTGISLRDSYAERGLLSSTLERLDQSIETGARAGKVISAVAESSLKGIGQADSFVRLITARSAELKFNQFLERGGLEATKPLGGKRELVEEVTRLLHNGQEAKARDLYIADGVATIQYDYGRGNKPEFSKGAIGKLTTMFMSYPLNTGEMVGSFAKRAIKGVQNRDLAEVMPMLRLMTLTSGLMFVGSEMLDADLSSALVIGSMPHSTFAPKLALDSWTAGRSTVEWGFGNIFDTGETQYAKQERLHAYKSLSNYATTFVPGYNAGLDATRVFDEGSIARALALTPKGPELDRLARERQRANRVQ